jgi:lactam utilization protein B
MKTYRVTIQISATTFAHISINADSMKDALDKASQRGMAIAAHPSFTFRKTEYMIIDK